MVDRLSTNLVKGSATVEKLHGQNYYSRGGAGWNYARARAYWRIDDEGGAKPQKRCFDSWIITRNERGGLFDTTFCSLDE